MDSVAFAAPPTARLIRGERRRLGISSRRPRVQACTSESMTAGDAMREWRKARDEGRVPRGPDGRAQPERIDVLFVGRDNSTVSVAAEAIFTDLCERRGLHAIACHSAGIRVDVQGQKPDRDFCDALRMKRKLDISRHMATRIDRSDLESYSHIICMCEKTRSELLYMLADERGKHSDDVEEKFVVLSNYCSEPRLQSAQFRAGRYSNQSLNLLLAALVDACNGLLMALLEPPASSSGKPFTI